MNTQGPRKQQRKKNTNPKIANGSLDLLWDYTYSSI